MEEKSDWRQRLRENRAVAEAREKLENDKVRYVLRLLFEIAVTLVFAACGNRDVSVCHHAGERHGAHHFRRGQVFYESGSLSADRPKAGRYHCV